MKTRNEGPADDVDVMVIGGGITGCAVARDAASRGLSVRLVERKDLAAGTSGRSTKLLHGGLRYLERGHLRLVREALRHVDERYREVMHLVYVEGLKVDETARILGTPEGTVKTRLMRGREALRKFLVRRHPEHFPS